MNQNMERPEDRAFGVETVKPVFGKKSFFNLLHLYFYRLTHEKIAYVILGLTLLGAFLTVFVGWETNQQLIKAAQESGKQASLSFSLSMVSMSCFALPSSLASMFYLANFLIISPSSTGSSIIGSFFSIGTVSLLYICFFFGREWHNRTFRNQILSGHGRLGIFSAGVISALVWALVCVAIWQIGIWGLGLAMKVPAFLPGQYGTVDSYGALFATCFFLTLLVFLTYAIVSVSWVYIIPSSWGAFGLLAASFVLNNLILTITLSLGTANGNTYYKFAECLVSYQYLSAMNCNIDKAAQYEFVENPYTGESSLQLVLVKGRATVNIIKTIASSLVISGAMYGFGVLVFTKRDLK